VSQDSGVFSRERGRRGKKGMVLDRSNVLIVRRVSEVLSFLLA